MKRSKTGGFTLMELLVTLVIVAIVSAIAIPNYTKYALTGKVSEATSTLASVRVSLEQYYQDNRNYGSTASTCGVAMPTGKYFTYTCNWGSGATNQGYLITATGNSTVGGATYTVDQANAKKTTAFPKATGLPKACWITADNGTC